MHDSHCHQNMTLLHTHAPICCTLSTHFPPLPFLPAPGDSPVVRRMRCKIGGEIKHTTLLERPLQSSLNWISVICDRHGKITGGLWQLRRRDCGGMQEWKSGCSVPPPCGGAGGTPPTAGDALPIFFCSRQKHVQEVQRAVRASVGGHAASSPNPAGCSGGRRSQRPRRPCRVRPSQYLERAGPERPVPSLAAGAAAAPPITPPLPTPCRVLATEAIDCVSTPQEFKEAFERRQKRCVSPQLVGRVISARNASGLREDTEQKLAYFWSASDALAKYLSIGYPEVIVYHSDLATAGLGCRMCRSYCIAHGARCAEQD